VLLGKFEKNIGKHEFLRIQDEHTQIVEQGDWGVSGDLNIPTKHKFIILPATTLLFDENTIFQKGNWILSDGTKAQPIHLPAKYKNWAGFVVISAMKKSTLK
jgi:hypothetical protein